MVNLNSPLIQELAHTDLDMITRLPFLTQKSNYNNKILMSFTNQLQILLMKLN